MNPLRSLESMIANLVEGAFGRAFRSEVRPIELARKLVREMDEHRTHSLSRVYAPNEYHVWLSPEDRARYEGVEAEVIDELCAYLLEHARREQLVLAGRPTVLFDTDEDLLLGEFGIEAKLVAVDREDAVPVAVPRRAPEGADGNTMIYSTSDRLRGPLDVSHARRGARAILLLEGKRLLVPPTGALIGRSRMCDIVIDDTGISRRHAELTPRDDGWMVHDLGSTNGVRINDETIQAPRRLRSGDRIGLGNTELTFQLR
jgi:hypothetical protein